MTETKLLFKGFPNEKDSRFERQECQARVIERHEMHSINDIIQA